MKNDKFHHWRCECGTGGSGTLDNAWAMMEDHVWAHPNHVAVVWPRGDRAAAAARRRKPAAEYMLVTELPDWFDADA